ncbi:MAG TPA: type I restriction enzyme HsdR N-terminal domain-containing protein, partial [Bacteroidales bacterium]|nr:type I restriction enzyme HsdR N-terminal domain-containing protein [Bacteroidales bacterium]
MTLSEILRDSNYRLTQFNLSEQQELEQRIILRTDSKGNQIPYVKCLVRSKEIRLTPEEVIRQLFIALLTGDYGYPLSRMELEHAVSFGREKKRADIVVFDRDNTTAPYIMVELKKPKLKDGKEQLKSYCNATGAPIGVWSNGDSISFYHRKDPNYFEDIPAIPKASEKLSDILSERWTIDDLIRKDKLVNERKSLKD